jgi:hypothetical protein
MCATHWEISEGWVTPPQLVGLCPDDEHKLLVSESSVFG